MTVDVSSSLWPACVTLYTIVMGFHCGAECEVTEVTASAARASRGGTLTFHPI